MVQRSRHLGIARVLAAAFGIFCVIISIGTPASADTKTIAQKRFGNVPVLWSGNAPSAFVVLMADPDAASPSYKPIAAALESQGAAVAILDAGVMRGILNTTLPAGQCNQLFGDIEDLVRLSERALGMQAWESPVFFGLGRSGTIAYLTLAQAPPNSVSGALSSGFSPSLTSKAAFCSGAPVLGNKDGAFEYGPIKLNGKWALFTQDPASTALKPFVAVNPGTSIEQGEATDGSTLSLAVKAVFDMTLVPKASISDLPLTELPAKNPTGLAIFLSGDGGWRDIDKQIGETLSKNGISVIGLDTLRYFWSEKNPQTIADDLDRIARYYRRAWHIQDVSLIGYSFGAATIPMVWTKLDPDLQKQVKLIVLMAPEPVGRLEMSMAGWLGIPSSADISLRPFMAELPKDKVTCIFSVEEKADGDTGCTLSELKGATLIERTGGHHFGGAYLEIAKLILDRWAAAERQH
ncbi:virulence factor family protein [Hyphomicrobium sp. MC8b]|jgi:type IV secretory pathway VirJ component|uniref:virulence factor family protein n=1 Tax=Hyphomicrobium sp. MC8b TaxID=300273 RepID=UPI00391D0752